MRTPRLEPGDTIKLKPRVLGNVRPAGTGRILSCLPEDKGLVRYRVQFENETFERSIGQEEDIDFTASPPSDQTGAASDEAGSSWVNSKAIRTGKTVTTAARSSFAGKRHR